MADQFRISEITAQHLARAAYPLVHAVHSELSLKDWLKRVKSLESRDGSRGIMAVQSAQGTIVAVFVYAVALRSTPAGIARGEAPVRTLSFTEVVCCEIPGLNIRPLIEAEARRLAALLQCEQIDTVDCSNSRLPATNH